jgi:hypothetical protein
MKERGVLPKHLCFQVSIPMVNGVLPPGIFPNQKRSRENQAGYAAATRGEIPTIIAKIPNDELALQWSCSRAPGRLRQHSGSSHRGILFHSTVRALTPTRLF